jgi:hypothetical protein
VVKRLIRLTKAVGQETVAVAYQAELDLLSAKP